MKTKSNNKKGLVGNSKPAQPITTSLLDKMEDGREFESLLKFKNIQVDFAIEIRKSLLEISS